MFRGINAVNMDAKGRMAVPTRYRDRIAQDSNNTLVLTIDTEEHCLLLYPVPAWEAIEAKLSDLPSFNQAARRIQRLLIGHATELELDSQGRILVPPLLRARGELEKKVILLGQGNKFEIWSEELWNQRRDNWLTQEGDDGDELPEELQSLSL